MAQTPQLRFASSNPSIDRRCRGCDEHVRQSTVRGFGDNHGRLFAYPSCSTHRDLKHGAGAIEDYDPETDRKRGGRRQYEDERGDV